MASQGESEDYEGMTPEEIQAAQEGAAPEEGDDPNKVSAETFSALMSSVFGGQTQRPVRESVRPTDPDAEGPRLKSRQTQGLGHIRDFLDAVPAGADAQAYLSDTDVVFNHEIPNFDKMLPVTARIMRRALANGTFMAHKSPQLKDWEPAMVQERTIIQPMQLMLRDPYSYSSMIGDMHISAISFSLMGIHVKDRDPSKGFLTRFRKLKEGAPARGLDEVRYDYEDRWVPTSRFIEINVRQVRIDPGNTTSDPPIYDGYYRSNTLCLGQVLPEETGAIIEEWLYVRTGGSWTSAVSPMDSEAIYLFNSPHAQPLPASK